MGYMRGESETFLSALRKMINYYSRENESNTPDFLLAEYLERCLQNYNTIVMQRDDWYGDNHDEVAVNNT